MLPRKLFTNTINNKILKNVINISPRPFAVQSGTKNETEDETTTHFGFQAVKTSEKTEKGKCYI